MYCIGASSPTCWCCYALEIASDYSYALVLIGDRFLTWLWTKLYNGIEVNNLDTVTGVASDHEIIYVPCHRSHIDYLLLSVFLPVYIGYEKLFEGRTYVGELMGRPKKKESLRDLLLTVRELKKNFGKVHVNFGEPIKLSDVLSTAHPAWRDEPVADDARPEWLVAGIDDLKRRIADGINDAAVANPVALVSLALLASFRHALDAQQHPASVRLAGTDRLPVVAQCFAQPQSPVATRTHGVSIPARRIVSALGRRRTRCSARPLPGRAD
jgi:glycerol-3-phosphate O-acyltransferase